MTAVAPAKTSMVGVRPLEFGVSVNTSNGRRSSSSSTGTNKVKAMLVWPIKNLPKFETLSYLPTLNQEQLIKQINYLLQNKWVPCLEFDEIATIRRVYHASPGYYDGRYWTMWKLPMFGCTDPSLVIREMGECRKEYPKAYIRCIGFDNVRQVQCISFIVSKPAGAP